MNNNLIISEDGKTILGVRDKSITSVTIPDSVTVIEEHAFKGCSSLKSVNIPDSVTEIGWRTFEDCTNLESINVNNSHPCYASINGVLYNKEKTTILQHPLGKLDCIFTVPDCVTEIGSNSFRDCLSLLVINIPDSVTEIGSDSFNGCSKLMAIIMKAEDPDDIAIGDDAFVSVNTEKCKLYVPKGTEGIYRAHPVFGMFKKILSYSDKEEEDHPLIDEPNSIICPNCNSTDHQPGAKFCLHCGASLIAIKCPKCGATDHQPRARFCLHCGASLTFLQCPNCKKTVHQSNVKFCLHCGSKLISAFLVVDQVDKEIIDETQKKQTVILPSNTPAGVEAVDLGLPSGILWASCNIDATKPEEYGGFYAWGETEVKECYDKGHYLYYGNASKVFSDLGVSISGTEYDVAHVKWGEPWQIPSRDHFIELITYCSSEKTLLNGIKGVKFTSFNGNSIFLPAAGRHTIRIIYSGDIGDYWSGEFKNGRDSLAYDFILRLWNGETDLQSNLRTEGRTIRPVLKTTYIFDIRSKIINNLLANMVRVEGSTFIMGATSEQDELYYEDELPTHKVKLSSFYIGRYEVTQEEWVAVMGDNPSHFKGAKCPVDSISWYDCEKFIQKLNTLTGLKFRLPTEAEWEFAARGGNKSKGFKFSGSDNIEDVAWYNVNSGDKQWDEESPEKQHLEEDHCKPHPVGQKSPNELGLYDMSGNLWEWCSDEYKEYHPNDQTDPKCSNGHNMVMRGGSWRDHKRLSRVSCRIDAEPTDCDCNNGIRLVL